MKHEIILDFGVVQGTRCVICGYWSQPNLPNYLKRTLKQNEAVM